MRGVAVVGRTVLVLGCCLAWACSSDSQGGGDRSGGSLDNSRLGNAKPVAPGVTNTNSSGPGAHTNAGSGAGDGTGGSTVTVGDLEGCTGSSQTAPPSGQPKVDIIWVVDASGSMLDEQMKIGANLTKFADDITSANVDVHIVMMTTSAAIPVICPVTPPDPLSGTALAGDPRYMFIDSVVDSNNLLSVVTSSYPQYKDFLRPDAVTHLVTVTDDESNYPGATPDERASMFKTDMTALLGKDFFQHTISSEGPTPCGDQNCMPDPNTGICFFVMLGCGAARPGDTYYSLASMTMGLTASICESDWQTIFDPLTQAVIASAPLPCNYPIPPPPKGEDLDPAKVNVGWIQPGASDKDQEVFPKAEDLAGCGDKFGWYYDSPSAPTQVMLCPATCTRVAAGGTLNVAFGCATVTID